MNACSTAVESRRHGMLAGGSQVLSPPFVYIVLGLCSRKFMNSLGTVKFLLIKKQTTTFLEEKPCVEQGYPEMDSIFSLISCTTTVQNLVLIKYCTESEI